MVRITLVGILIYSFSLFAVSPAIAQDGDWWHTNYETQTVIGGSNPAPATMPDTHGATTLPVAGNTEITVAFLIFGLVFLAIGINYLKTHSCA